VSSQPRCCHQDVIGQTFRKTSDRVYVLGPICGYPNEGVASWKASRFAEMGYKVWGEGRSDEGDGDLGLHQKYDLTHDLPEKGGGDDSVALVKYQRTDAGAHLKDPPALAHQLRSSLKVANDLLSKGRIVEDRLDCYHN
jgi:hypothetical protein